MVMCCCGHFVVNVYITIQPLAGYHKELSRYRGESMYRFSVRKLAFGYRNAYRIAEDLHRRPSYANA